MSSSDWLVFQVFIAMTMGSWKSIFKWCPVPGVHPIQSCIQHVVMFLLLDTGMSWIQTWYWMLLQNNFQLPMYNYYSCDRPSHKIIDQKLLVIIIYCRVGNWSLLPSKIGWLAFFILPLILDTNQFHLAWQYTTSARVLQEGSWRFGLQMSQTYVFTKNMFLQLVFMQ